MSASGKLSLTTYELVKRILHEVKDEVCAYEDIVPAGTEVTVDNLARLKERLQQLVTARHLVNNGSKTLLDSYSLGIRMAVRSLATIQLSGGQGECGELTDLFVVKLLEHGITNFTQCVLRNPDKPNSNHAYLCVEISPTESVIVDPLLNICLPESEFFKNTLVIAYLKQGKLDVASKKEIPLWQFIISKEDQNATPQAKAREMREASQVVVRACKSFLTRVGWNVNSPPNFTAASTESNVASASASRSPAGATFFAGGNKTTPAPAYVTFNAIGVQYLKAGFYKKAIEQFTQALNEIRDLSGDQTPILKSVLYNLGKSELAAKWLEEAEGHLAEALFFAEKMIVNDGALDEKFQKTLDDSRNQQLEEREQGHVISFKL